MPLSKEQIAALKENSTVISFQNGNPKKAGTKAHERFEKYKHSTTIGDAMFNGANWQDLSSDFEKNYMSVPHLMVCDGEHAGSVKRTAPEGTPDREALARSKMPSTDIVPKVLDPQPEDEVSRVEMSPATIALLRSMMRDEIKHGLDELESKFATSINQSVHMLREELSAEKGTPACFGRTSQVVGTIQTFMDKFSWTPGRRGSSGQVSCGHRRLSRQRS